MCAYDIIDNLIISLLEKLKFIQAKWIKTLAYLFIAMQNNYDKEQQQFICKLKGTVWHIRHIFPSRTKLD